MKNIVKVAIVLFYSLLSCGIEQENKEYVVDEYPSVLKEAKIKCLTGSGGVFSKREKYSAELELYKIIRNYESNFFCTCAAVSDSILIDFSPAFIERTPHREWFRK
jgi:hypothetical protein